MWRISRQRATAIATPAVTTTNAMTHNPEFADTAKEERNKKAEFRKLYEEQVRTCECDPLDA